MAKLVLTLDGKIINQYFIDKPCLTIGRDSGNDIAIDDSLLSRAHARITQLGDDDIVEDLQSSNGTRINGRPLGRHILQHRDVVDLGGHQLRYMSSRNAADVELDRTMIIESLTQVREASAGGGVVADEAVINLPLAESARARLVAGSVTVLAATPQHTVGEVVRLDRVVTTFGVPGKTLLVLTRRPQGVFLTHVEGADFPQVGGRSIGDRAYALRDGDVIKGAGCQLKFSLVQPAVR